MLRKVVRALRWATGIAIGLTAALLIVAVTFALLGFRETAERINDVVMYFFPVDMALVALLLIALLVVSLAQSREEPPAK
jgi:hypothetical protein